MHQSPHCHSIVGQKLLLVDWITMCGLRVRCVSCADGILENDRTNFSKNKLLFPIFQIEGSPQWCVVMSMTCSCCKRRANANNGSVLAAMPSHAAAACPVTSTCALPKNSHLGKLATDAFDFLMTTCGNGELCSGPLHNAMSRAHTENWRIATPVTSAVARANSQSHTWRRSNA